MLIHSSARGKSQEYHILNLCFNVFRDKVIKENINVGPMVGVSFLI